MKAPEPSPSLGAHSDDDARVEQMLAESSQPYVANDGFSERVLSALPPSQRHAERRRAILLCGAGILGGCPVLLLGGNGLVACFAAMTSRLAGWSALPVPGLGPAFTAGVAACWILTVAAGWWAWVRTR